MKRFRSFVAIFLAVIMAVGVFAAIPVSAAVDERELIIQIKDLIDIPPAREGEITYKAYVTPSQGGNWYDLTLDKDGYAKLKIDVVGKDITFYRDDPALDTEVDAGIAANTATETVRIPEDCNLAVVTFKDSGNTVVWDCVVPVEPPVDDPKQERIITIEISDFVEYVVYFKDSIQYKAWVTYGTRDDKGMRTGRWYDLELNNGSAQIALDADSEELTIVRLVPPITGDTVLCSRTHTVKIPENATCATASFGPDTSGKQRLIWDVADKTKLEKAIKDAENAIKPGDKFTDETLKAFNEAFEKAQAVYDDSNAVQKEIDKAAEDLNKAINGLERPDLDYSEIQRLMDEAENICKNKDLYTEESYNAFYEVYHSVIPYYYTANSQAILDRITLELKDAIEQLEYISRELSDEALKEKFYKYANISGEYKFCYIISKDKDYTLIRGGSGISTNLVYPVVMGDYVFLCLSQDQPYDLGYFIYKNGKFKTLSQAYVDGDIDIAKVAEEQIGLRHDLQKLTKINIGKIECTDKKSYDFYYSGLDSVDYKHYGKIYSLGSCTVCVNYSAEGDSYSKVYNANLGLYLEDEKGNRIDLQDAYDKGMFNPDTDFKAMLSKVENSNKLFTFNSEPDEDEPLKTLKAVIKKNLSGVELTDDDIYVNVFEKLSNGTYLVHYTFKDAVYTREMVETRIGKYMYATGRPMLQIFDGKKLYELLDAYNKNVIDDKCLDEIAAHSPRNFTYIKSVENNVMLDAGKRYNVKLELSNNKLNDISRTLFWKSSNEKIAYWDGNKIVALKKGTVTFTPDDESYKDMKVKVTVKSDPKLTKKGKKVSTVTVAKNKTVSVKLSGKAKGVNYSYTNSKLAKVVSKKSADIIKIKGLKRGTSTLKITVNGKKLSLKVKVK